MSRNTANNDDSKRPHIVALATQLDDWPSSTEEHNEFAVDVECAGPAFLEYQIFRHRGESTPSLSRQASSVVRDDDEDDDNANDDDAALAENGHASATPKKGKNHNPKSLLKLSEAQLNGLTYYEILGDLPIHASSDDIKKGYRRASLLYHPDKTGLAEESNPVFLKVQAAFETLSDPSKRKSYDSTALTFDDSIPKGNEPEEEFYETYRPVFERNLRFDARLDPGRHMNQNSASQAKNNNKRSKKKGHHAKGGTRPTELGDDNTPLEQVHAFYDYWIHFESWRDFSLQAAEETQIETDNAESRYEKRWLQQQVDRHAKALKREEISRITKLVERAMAADPRLRRERIREQEEKQRLIDERRLKQEEEAKRKQEEEEERQRIEGERQKAEQEARAVQKVEREQLKKQLRKGRQALRKLALGAYQEGQDQGQNVYKSIEEFNDDLELLCSELTLSQLADVTEDMSDTDQTLSPSSILQKVHQLAAEVRNGQMESFKELAEQTQRRQAAAAAKAAAASRKPETVVWNKDELSTLAKGIKKFPPGGSGRWESIANYINSACRPQQPKTKEQCIEKYNQISKGHSSQQQQQQPPPQPVPAATTQTVTTNGTAPVASSPTPATSTSSNNHRGAPFNRMASVDSTTSNVDGDDNDDVWTEEQDKQLQIGLAQFPASMDKNERWASIAKAVQGKNKKQCVLRFKAIREAIKSKK